MSRVEIAALLQPRVAKTFMALVPTEVVPSATAVVVTPLTAQKRLVFCSHIPLLQFQLPLLPIPQRPPLRLTAPPLAQELFQKEAYAIAP